MTFGIIVSDHLLVEAVMAHHLMNTMIVEVHHHQEATVHHDTENVHLGVDHLMMSTMTEAILVDLLLQETTLLPRGDMRTHMIVGLLPHLLLEVMILTLVEIHMRDPEVHHHPVAMAATEVVPNIEDTMSADRTRQVRHPNDVY